MKKVALSALAAAMISGVVSADALTLYSDPKTGQVYTTPGEGRVEMGDFIDAKTVDLQMRDMESKGSEYQEKMKKYVNVKSKAKTLEFSGTHYFGLTSNNYGSENYNGGDKSTGFELRRNYLQVKAYFNDKDYFRVTMDTTKELESSTTYATMYAKYAYLYLDEVLPYTGVEIGIAHRPWIDYEEHNSWYFRSINKVILEDKFSVAAGASGASKNVGPDVLNSADLGVNFKTKTDYFSSELGIFNGEGYHADKAANNQQNSSDLSFEWRLTGHILGNGTKVGKYKRDQDTYANISFAGLSSKNHKDNSVVVDDAAEYDRNAYWFHFVYNQPEFLIAAQYDVSKDEVQRTNAETKLKMWSVNAEVRPFQDWTVLARYDNLKTEYSNDATKNANDVGDADQFIYGIAYAYNKNVNFILSGKTVDAKDKSAFTRVDATTTTLGDALDKQSYMLTTEVKW
ncbi:hypothetical protein [Sulfuricurvum sp.]|uniref:hypothetical protein n=2 Tax=Sulfuricurvum sp. TaxID=2025608 RepID=UPI00261F20B0|nr:hypothetical protein [Sulfuricurvum sp.]MDD4883998.1 hypothetical protein [Sulfuricurvum sp.]